MTNTSHDHYQRANEIGRWDSVEYDLLGGGEGLSDGCGVITSFLRN